MELAIACSAAADAISLRVGLNERELGLSFAAVCRWIDLARENVRNLRASAADTLA